MADTVLVQQHDGSHYAYNYYGMAQTFTMPSSKDVITRVKVRLFRVGSVGTIRVGIKNTSSGKPTGSFLTSTTKSGSNITTSSSGAVYTFDFSDLAVTAGAKYAVCVESYNSTNLRWKASESVTGSSSSYSGGNPYWKASSGAWNSWGADMYFEVWGYKKSYAPTVSTSSISNIAQTSVTAGGVVSSDGGATITERGVVYSTNANPTTSSSKVTVSGTTGAFSTNITGLSAGTTYYFRAYAINANGTSYGSNVTCTTTSATPPRAIEFGIDSVYIEVFYEPIPTSSMSSVLDVAGHITNNKTYRISVGDVNYNNQVYEDMELILDLDQMVVRGQPVWTADLGVNPDLYATFTDSNGEIHEVRAVETGAMYEDNDDYINPVELTWQSQDFLVGSDTEEMMLQGVFMQYKPDKNSTIPIKLYARADMGTWIDIGTYNLPASTKDFEYIRIESAKAVRGRTMGIKLVSSDDKKFSLYRIGLLLASNKAKIRPLKYED